MPRKFNNDYDILLRFSLVRDYKKGMKYSVENNITAWRYSSGRLKILISCQKQIAFQLLIVTFLSMNYFLDR